MDGGATEPERWREIAAQKEKEWKEVTEQRIQSLEAACEDKERQLCDGKAKMQKLKEDFKYNLRLLEDRDQELERYDTSFAAMKAEVNTKNADVSECKIQVDELKTKLCAEVKSREELQLHYQQRLREKAAEIDSFRMTKDGEMQEERKEFESFKRNLQRRLTEVEEEMDTQKREVTVVFDDALRRREHEFRLQADEMSTKVLEYELKAKLLGKELELVKAAQERNSAEFGEVETNHRELEKRLKEKDWAIQDLTAMKDATIADLQNNLRQSEATVKRLQEEYKRKHTEMDRYCREKEGALTKVKEAGAERESELQATVRALEARQEEAAVEVRRLQWAAQDLEKEKDTYIQKLQEESQQLKEKWDRQIVDVSRSQVSKDLELQNLHESDEKLRLELVQKKEDISRYKKELSAAVEREAGLERGKAQLELDWQRRHDDLERQQYLKSEELIQKLTRSRDEALATVKQKERELHQKDMLIKALQTDREQAFVTLKKHGIKVDKNVNIEVARAASTSSEDMSDLQEQNANLRAVIREMRQQMEQLGHHVPDKNLQPSRGDKITEEYVRGLEKDCRELRQKNRELEQDADVARRFGRHPGPQPSDREQEVLTEVKDNALVRSHIQSLNDTIGSLRAEKVELTAQVKKHQAHVQYQERRLEDLAKEPREKQVQIDQLQYELGATSRRTQAEIASLRQRISELELQLIEARKEADEYYKGSLERNMEVTALGQELSGLKVDLAQKRPEINFGAQELLIQQLQDEIMNLKHQGADLSLSGDIPRGQGQTTNTTIQLLQKKLTGAAKKIAELAKERQQLIEMGNKLRAELKKTGIEIPTMATGRQRPSRQLPPPIREEPAGHVTPQPLSEQFMNKLSQLEKLQYQLTRQELQYAQNYPGKASGATPRYTEPEHRPPSILKKPGVRDSMDTEVDVRASVNTEGGETVATARSLPSQLMLSMSSMGGESLQDIWRLLEDGRPTPTPRLSSEPAQRGARFEGHDVNMSQNSDTGSSGSLHISGKPAGRSKQKPEKKLPDRVAGRVKKKAQQKSAVRNYNYRDDNDMR